MYKIFIILLNDELVQMFLFQTIHVSSLWLSRPHQKHRSRSKTGRRTGRETIRQTCCHCCCS